MKMFFKTLVDPNISLGAQDYYVVMLFFDLLCFITLVLGQTLSGSVHEAKFKKKKQPIFKSLVTQALQRFKYVDDSIVLFLGWCWQ